MVRHAPTHRKTMVGWSDVAADVSDSARFERLRTVLPNAPVISSDLQRARITADQLNRSPRLPDDAMLRELNFGQWELRGFADVEQENPELIRAYWETPGDVRAPDGESWNQLCARVNSAMERLAELGHPDLIVVAHFGSILTQVQRGLGLTAYQAFGHKIENLSITQITHENGVWSAGMINHHP